jgi:hypothetical protein
MAHFGSGVTRNGQAGVRLRGGHEPVQTSASVHIELRCRADHTVAVVDQDHLLVELAQGDRPSVVWSQTAPS